MKRITLAAFSLPLLLLSGCGDAGADPVAVEVVETIEATTVPQACIDALGAADDLLDISASLTSLVAQHLKDEGVVWTEIDRGNLDAVAAYTDQVYDFNDGIIALTEDVEANPYASLREDCLAQQ